MGCIQWLEEEHALFVPALCSMLKDGQGARLSARGLGDVPHSLAGGQVTLHPPLASRLGMGGVS